MWYSFHARYSQLQFHKCICEREFIFVYDWPHSVRKWSHDKRWQVFSKTRFFQCLLTKNKEKNLLIPGTNATNVEFRPQLLIFQPFYAKLPPSTRVSFPVSSFNRYLNENVNNDQMFEVSPPIFHCISNQADSCFDFLKQGIRTVLKSWNWAKRKRAGPLSNFKELEDSFEFHLCHVAAGGGQRGYAPSPTTIFIPENDVVAAHTIAIHYASDESYFFRFISFLFQKIFSAATTHILYFLS